MTEEVDVLVIGGGILGICVALFLARDGVGTIVLDSATLGGSTINAGSLHVQMQSRFIRLETSARVATVRKHQRIYVAAVRAWERLAGELDSDVELIVKGGLMLAETQEQLAFLSAKCAEEARLGLAVEMLSAAEVRRVAPYLGETVVGAEFCADEGKINTLLANPALERAARRAGARIQRPATVTRVARHPTGGFEVTSTVATFRCGRVVNAAGGGAGTIAAMLGVTIPVESEPLHMNVTEPIAPMMAHLVQHADKQLTLKQAVNGNVVIGGGRPAFVDAASGLPSVFRTSIEGNLSLAIHIAPWLADVKLIRTWAGINAKTDGLPVLGRMGPPGAFAAVSGDAGYSLGPLCARWLVELMQGRDPGYDLSDFGLERFS